MVVFNGKGAYLFVAYLRQGWGNDTDSYTSRTNAINTEKRNVIIMTANTRTYSRNDVKPKTNIILTMSDQARNVSRPLMEAILSSPIFRSFPDNT